METRFRAEARGLFNRLFTLSRCVVPLLLCERMRKYPDGVSD